MTSGYLFDTSVVSALAPDRPPIVPAIAAWIIENSARIYLPAIVIAELEQGICGLRRRGGTERPARLATWLERLLTFLADQIVPFDAAAGLLAGRLSDETSAAGRHPGFADVAIGATALANGLTLLTRNIRHFELLGVDLVDPFEKLPL